MLVHIRKHIGIAANKFHIRVIFYHLPDLSNTLSQYRRVQFLEANHQKGFLEIEIHHLFQIPLTAAHQIQLEVLRYGIIGVGDFIISFFPLVVKSTADLTCNFGDGLRCSHFGDFMHLLFQIIDFFQ